MTVRSSAAEAETARRVSIAVVIEGVSLPGSSFGPYHDVRAGMGPEPHAQSLVAGDADSATWRFKIVAKRSPDGGFDAAGSYVNGRRGERFLYINWIGTLPDGRVEGFRRAKLPLRDAPIQDLVALGPAAELVGRIRLTDRKGGPACATIHSPDLEWSVRAVVGG
jgi:Family of unknown function (DUF5990)